MLLSPETSPQLIDSSSHGVQKRPAWRTAHSPGPRPQSIHARFPIPFRHRPHVVAKDSALTLAQQPGWSPMRFEACLRPNEPGAFEVGRPAVFRTSPFGHRRARNPSGVWVYEENVAIRRIIRGTGRCHNRDQLRRLCDHATCGTNTRTCAKLRRTTSGELEQIQNTTA
jgi:hypothetical protein